MDIYIYIYIKITYYCRRMTILSTAPPEKKPKEVGHFTLNEKLGIKNEGKTNVFSFCQECLIGVPNYQEMITSMNKCQISINNKKQ